MTEPIPVVLTAPTISPHGGALDPTGPAALNQICESLVTPKWAEPAKKYRDYVAEEPHHVSEFAESPAPTSRTDEPLFASRSYFEIRRGDVVGFDGVLRIAIKSVNRISACADFLVTLDGGDVVSSNLLYRIGRIEKTRPTPSTEEKICKILEGLFEKAPSKKSLEGLRTETFECLYGEKSSAAWVEQSDAIAPLANEITQQYVPMPLSEGQERYLRSLFEGCYRRPLTLLSFDGYVAKAATNSRLRDYNKKESFKTQWEPTNVLRVRATNVKTRDEVWCAKCETYYDDVNDGLWVGHECNPTKHAAERERLLLASYYEATVPELLMADFFSRAEQMRRAERFRRAEQHRIGTIEPLQRRAEFLRNLCRDCRYLEEDHKGLWIECSAHLCNLCLDCRKYVLMYKAAWVESLGDCFEITRAHVTSLRDLITPPMEKQLDVIPTRRRKPEWAPKNLYYPTDSTVVCEVPLRNVAPKSQASLESLLAQLPIESVDGKVYRSHGSELIGEGSRQLTNFEDRSRFGKGGGVRVNTSSRLADSDMKGLDDTKREFSTHRGGKSHIDGYQQSDYAPQGEKCSRDYRANAIRKSREVAQSVKVCLRPACPKPNKTFTPTKITQKYCDPTCCKMHWKEQRKQPKENTCQPQHLEYPQYQQESL